MSPQSVRAWAPASVGNVGCGLDTLGLAIEAKGDVVTARAGERLGVYIRTIRGDGGRLPLEADRNTASVAASYLLRVAGRQASVELEIDKGIPLASGLGSSAASAVAGAVAVDALLNLGASPLQLLTAAVAAEERNCGAAHADNAAPSLLSGFTLVRPSAVPEAIRLPCPPSLAVAILHPAVELTTRASRSLLPSALPLEKAVAQWSNIGAFVAALHSGDLPLLGRAMKDHVSEPARAGKVPGFAQTKAAAIEAGALGASLSGAGPSIFALCNGMASAERVSSAMSEAFEAATGISCEAFPTAVDRRGARILEAVE